MNYKTRITEGAILYVDIARDVQRQTQKSFEWCLFSTLASALVRALDGKNL